MTIDQAALLAAATIFFYMNCMYAIAMVRKNAGLVDIAWGPGFVVTATLLLALQPYVNQMHVIMYAAILLWGLRLGWHIGKRNLGEPEDWRYAQWRKDWGYTYWWRSYLQIFMLQGLMMFIISASFIVAMTAMGQDFMPAAILIGAVVWLVGYYFEIVGDYQLERFVKQKKAGTTKQRIMTSGLWAYTRHPNSFGEVTMWWGLWIMVAGAPYWWLALMSPIVITILIVLVSGIPMLEKKYQDDTEFKRYARKTSKFFPLPPKK